MTKLIKNMEKDKNKVVMCPSCQCRYRVSDAFLGRRVFCKRCGTKFELGLQEETKVRKAGQGTPDMQEEIEEISHSDSCLVIGKLAMKHKFVNEEQIRGALTIQEQEKGAGHTLPLGEILVNQGMISQSQMDFLLSVQKMAETRQLDRTFATIAVKNGFATREEIEGTLKEQKRLLKETQTVKLIGDMLVESGLLEERQKDAILMRQKRIQEDTLEKNKEDEAPGNEKPVRKGPAFELSVSEDRLSAFISPSGEMPCDTSVEDIKKFLDEKGITYGIAGNSLIEEYLKDGNALKKPWKIAEGKAARPGIDARVKYYFDTEPLRTGTVKEDGAIDFKDRGEIPNVKEGDLIAQKIPCMDGDLGIDVFGKEIPAIKSKDIKLLCGKGTKKSDDQLKVFATLDGRALISPDGRLSVSQELIISGDVGLETGHIDFNGSIIVSGTVQNGFRVRGGTLSAGEIMKAEIEIDGDITVRGGIIGTDIRTGGNLKAKFIRQSNIKALGDVVAEKAILDSEIESSGSCNVKRGKIFASQVSAKKGIEANEIGSYASRPSTFTVGIDERVENEIKKIHEQIDLKKEELEKINNMIQESKENDDEMNNKIGELAQVQDSAMVQLRVIRENMEELKKASDKVELEQAEKDINELKSKIKEVEKILLGLLDAQELITERVTDFQNEKQVKGNEIDVLIDEINSLSERAKQEMGIPSVKVSGLLLAGNCIKGPHSSIVLGEDMKGVIIRETKSIDPDSNDQWMMKVSSLDSRHGL